MRAELEAIEKGMSTEIWGRRFYEQAAQHTVSEDGKRVFENLATEEAGHLDILRGQYAVVSEQGRWASLGEAIGRAESVDLSGVFPDMAAAETLIPEDATDEVALGLAMEFEQKGFTLYDRAAKEASSPQEAEIWAHLAKAEDKHFTLLQDAYDYLTTNGTWYFDDTEKPFFEG